LEDYYYDSEEDNDYNLEEENYDDCDLGKDLGDEDDKNDKGSTYKNLHETVKASKTTNVTNTSIVLFVFQ
jgi:hypothetical protein